MIIVTYYCYYFSPLLTSWSLQPLLLCHRLSKFNLQWFVWLAMAPCKAEWTDLPFCLTFHIYVFITLFLFLKIFTGMTNIYQGILFYSFFLSFFLFVFCIFRAAPVAYGGSQARGRIRAADASLHYTTATATPDLSHVCNLHHSSRQRWILNPLSKAKIEPTTSWFLVGFVSTAPQWELQEILFYDVYSGG